MAKQEKETWYSKLENKVTAYKIFKLSLGFFAVLGATTMFILSIVFVDKLFMALAYLAVFLYYVVSIVDIIYSNRLNYGLFDLFLSITCALLSLLAMLCSFNVLDWFKYVLGIILTLIVVLFSSSSTPLFDTFDILDWEQKNNFVEGAIVFGVFLVVLFFFPVRDIIKVCDYDELREQEFLAEKNLLKKNTTQTREDEESKISVIVRDEDKNSLDEKSEKVSKSEKEVNKKPTPTKQTTYDKESLKQETKNVVSPKNITGSNSKQNADKESLIDGINPNDYIKDPKDNFKIEKQYSLKMIEKMMKEANSNLEKLEKELKGEKEIKAAPRPTSESSEDYFDESLDNTESSANESNYKKHKEKK